MPINARLSLAQSRSSKTRSATEPSDEPPLHPTELNLIMRLRVWLDKLAPLPFARYLITFFVGVAATLGWQSYRDAAREQTIAAAPARLDLVRPSVDKLALRIPQLPAAAP